MTQQGRKNISVTDQTFETLRSLGNTADSFNDVIQKLILKAASGQTLAGTGQTTAAPLQTPAKEVQSS